MASETQMDERLRQGGAAEAERFVAWSQDRFWVRAG